jgi:two-component system, OmpR family, phosphate regulon response regulator PhoB
MMDTRNRTSTPRPAGGEERWATAPSSQGGNRPKAASVTKETILIIEDDPDIVELVQYNLEREGFRVVTATDGESGLREATTRKPNLILLDLMLPGINGLEVCRLLKQREETSPCSVIMLTAKGEESDIVLGLEMGSDDYVSKPFSPKELLARVRAVLRRAKRKTGSVPARRLEVAEIVLDAERHEVYVSGELIYFTRAEFRLLWTLLEQPGRVFTRNELVERITAGESYILDRNVDVHVSAIRKKLGSQGHLVATVRGVGYKCLD